MQLGIILLAFVVLAGCGYTLWYFYYNTKAVNNILLDNRMQNSENPTGSHHEASREFGQWIDQTAELVHSIHPDYQVGVYWWSPGSESVILQNPTGSVFQETVTLSHPILHKILKKDKFRIFQEKDIRDDWNNLLKQQVWRGSECVLGTPFGFQGRVSGCLILYIDHFNKISDRDKHLLQTLSRLFEAGFTRIQEVDYLQSLQLSIQQIYGLYSKINVKSTLDDAYELVDTLCRQLFKFDRLTIVLKMPDEMKPKIRFSTSHRAEELQGVEIQSLQTVYGYALEKEISLSTGNWKRQFPDFSLYGRQENNDPEYPTVLSAFIALNHFGRGALVLERKEEEPFTKSDRSLLELTARVIGEIVPMIQQYRVTSNKAMYDQLTGLYNRYILMDRVAEEMSRSVRFQQQLSLLVLDLDKFKKINDTYGHVYGDFMLKKVASLILANVRNIDVVARYGGEEFVVLLVNASPKSAEIVARRILQSIANFTFDENGIQTHITISGGMAQFNEKTKSVKHLIELADEALYEAKRMGGNRVEVYKGDGDV